MLRAMGRVYDTLRVNGHALHALFDTGAVSSYIARARTPGLTRTALKPAMRVGIGGSRRTITEVCTFQARLRGNAVTFTARVTDSLGRDEDGRDIDLIAGALFMEEWNVRVDPRRRALDLSRIRREFVEY